MRALAFVISLTLLAFYSSLSPASAEETLRKRAFECAGAIIEGACGARTGGLPGAIQGAASGWEHGAKLHDYFYPEAPAPAPAKPYSRNEGGVGYCSDDNNCDLKAKR
jgi:hypothetical protein